MEIKFLVILLSSFLFTLIFAPFFIDFLYKFNIRRISKADLDDKIPDRALKFGTPIMGGFLITISTLILSTIFLRDWDMFYPFVVVLVAGSIVGFIDEYINTIGRKGFSYAVREKVDAVLSKNKIFWSLYKVILIPWDVFKEAFRIMGSSQRGIKTHEKFLMQFLVAFVGVYWLYFKLGYNTLWLPFLGEIFLGIWFVPVVVFICLGFANAFGVTDGMDGLSAGLHSFAFLGYGVLALMLGVPSIAFFCAAIVGSELAFLYFNIHPARIEMSDVGTLPLGILFVLIAVYLHREVTLPIIGGVFVIEILSSFLQVWSVKLRGKRILLIAPIHHHFEKLGWHETKVTMRFWLAGAVLSLAGILVGLI